MFSPVATFLMFSTVGLHSESGSNNRSPQKVLKGPDLCLLRRSSRLNVENMHLGRRHHRRSQFRYDFEVLHGVSSILVHIGVRPYPMSMNTYRPLRRLIRIVPLAIMSLKESDSQNTFVI